jgi:hypothetical protein
LPQAVAERAVGIAEGVDHPGRAGAAVEHPFGRFELGQHPVAHRAGHQFLQPHRVTLVAIAVYPGANATAAWWKPTWASSPAPAWPTPCAAGSAQIPFPIPWSDHVPERFPARAADSTDPVDDVGTPAELRPVMAALNGLLARLAAALGQQSAFTDDAAHELRTPLTVVDTHLQVAQITPVADPGSLRKVGFGIPGDKTPGYLAAIKMRIKELLNNSHLTVIPANAGIQCLPGSTG